MGEMRLTTSPEALPGSCVQCGSAPSKSRHTFVDTGRFEEFHGQVYYCNICVGLMMELFGFADDVSVGSMMSRIVQLEDQLFQSTIQKDALGRALHELDIAGYRSVSDPPQPDPVSAPDPVEPEADSEPDDGPQGPASELGDSAGTADEPSDDQGVVVVPASAGSDEFAFDL